MLVGGAGEAGTVLNNKNMGVKRDLQRGRVVEHFHSKTNIQRKKCLSRKEVHLDPCFFSSSFSFVLLFSKLIWRSTKYPSCSTSSSCLPLRAISMQNIFHPFFFFSRVKEDSGRCFCVIITRRSLRIIKTLKNQKIKSKKKEAHQRDGTPSFVR